MKTKGKMDPYNQKLFIYEAFGPPEYPQKLYLNFLASPKKATEFEYLC